MTVHIISISNSQKQKSRALTYTLNVAAIAHGDVYRTTLIYCEVLQGSNTCQLFHQEKELW